MHEFCCILLSNITPSSSVHLTVQWRYMATTLHLKTKVDSTSEASSSAD